jgi:hypothetical protein
MAALVNSVKLNGEPEHLRILRKAWDKKFERLLTAPRARRGLGKTFSQIMYGSPEVMSLLASDELIDHFISNVDTEPEGKRLAELLAEVNARYSIGLEQWMVKRSRPGDDDGSFVQAGYPNAVINIGSFPYGDPNYHLEGDVPEKCDIENAAMTVQATLATILTIDRDL